MKTGVKTTAEKSMAKTRNPALWPQKPVRSKPVGSPIDEIMRLQRTVGNQAVQGLIKKQWYAVNFRCRHIRKD